MPTSSRLPPPHTRAAASLCGAVATVVLGGCVGTAPPARADAPVVAASTAEAARPTTPETRATDGVARAEPACRGTWRARENETSRFTLPETCPTDGDTRWFLVGGPAALAWDTRTATGSYTPDWLEGGSATTLTLEAWRNGAPAGVAVVELTVDDIVAPPDLVLARTEDRARSALRHYTLHTDDFLDAPSRAGRDVDVIVAVPHARTEPPLAAPQRRYPVRVNLHGLSGQPWAVDADEIVVSMHDPENTYWWGYRADGAPAGDDTASTPDYTLRKVMHALAWTLRELPSADPARVQIHGPSMGGAGAATAGLLYARHFAAVSAHIGQTIPRNHRATRVQTLSRLWGPPSPAPRDAAAATSLWDHLDLTRVLLQDPIARDQFVFTRHGKDDAIIHFGAVVQPSPLTGLSFYDALRATRVGHYVVWDESGHGDDDPLLPAGWWDSGWDPLTDASSRLAMNLAYPAFSRASHDDDPGTFAGRPGATPNTDGGWVGRVDVPGDTGWVGDIAGAWNRGLRWNSDAIVDSVPAFSIPLFVHAGDGGDAPRPGYPCTFDRLCTALPISADVTIRRPQAFRLAPGEQVRWRFGQANGVVSADDDGRITVSALALTTEPATLTLERIWPDRPVP